MASISASWYRHWANGVVNSGTDVWKTNSDVRTGVTNKKKTSGWMPPNPYSRKIQRVTLPFVEGWGQQTRNGAPYGTACSISGVLKTGGYGAIGLPSTTSAKALTVKDLALLRCMASFSSSPINIGQSLGERRETAKFVGDAAMEAVSFVRAIKRRDLGAIRRLLLGRRDRQRYHRSTIHEVLSRPSKIWLVDSYALKPLMADVYGSLEVLEKRENSAPPIITRKGRAKDSDPWIRPTANPPYYSHAVGEVVADIPFYTQDSYRCMVRLDAQMENDALFRLNQCGVVNPLALAYELIPLSFVADQFFNFGNYLNALTAFVGLDFKGGSCSLMAKRTSRLGPVKKFTKTGSLATGVSPSCRLNFLGEYKVDNIALQRTVYDSFVDLFPPPLPPFEGHVTGNRILSWASLLTVLTDGKRK